MKGIYRCYDEWENNNIRFRHKCDIHRFSRNASQKAKDTHKLLGLRWRLTILKVDEKYDLGKRWINVGQQIQFEGLQ